MSVDNIARGLALRMLAGVKGDSAYEVAVANGFVGTQTEWLATINGTDGNDGIDGTNGINGLSAYQIAVANGFVGTEAEWLASLQGEDGVGGGSSLLTIVPVATAAYEFVLSDGGCHVRFSNVGDVTATVPNNATVPFPIGTRIRCTAAGAGTVFLAKAASVVLNSREGALQSSGQFAVFEIEKVGTDEWDVLGDVVFISKQYRFWKLKMSVANNAGGDILIPEIELRETLGGPDVTGSGTATGSVGHYTGTEGPDKAFNNNTGDWWQPNTTANGGTVEIIYDFGSAFPKEIVQAVIHANPGFVDRTPQVVEILRSQDGGFFSSVAAFSGLTPFGTSRTLSW